jgi:hypothetical protein
LPTKKAAARTSNCAVLAVSTKQTKLRDVFREAENTPSGFAELLSSMLPILSVL